MKWLSMLFLVFSVHGNSLDIYEWKLSESQPNPSDLYGKLIDNEQGFSISLARMSPSNYGGQGRVGLEFVTINSPTRKECGNLSLRTPKELSMRLMKVGETWVKLVPICYKDESEDTFDGFDYFIHYTPQTYGDLIKLIKEFRKESSIDFLNHRFSAKGFIKVYNEYSNRLGYPIDNLILF